MERTVPPLITLSQICKSFGKVKVLDDVDLHLHANEVLGVVGDNGAGKSTLIKILSGVIQADSGRFFIKETPIDLKRYNVGKARSFGIETVHQDRALGEKQPIWRNLFMGRHRRNALGMIRKAEEKAEALALLTSFLGLSGAGISPDAPVSVLSGGERQGLAIGRAIHFDSDILVLDEPCTALAVNEVEKVLSFIFRAKKRGKAVILISHTLSHLHDVCDRFIFLNRGKVADNIHKSDIDLQALTHRLMALSRGEAS